MVGEPRRFSTSTPCAFMETSMAAAVIPNANSATKRLTALNASPGKTSARLKPAVEKIVTLLLPWRPTRIPVRGMEETAPNAEPSNVSPSTALFNFRSDCTVGILEIHVETIRPCKKKYVTVAHHALPT